MDNCATKNMSNKYCCLSHNLIADIHLLVCPAAAGCDCLQALHTQHPAVRCNSAGSSSIACPSTQDSTNVQKRQVACNYSGSRDLPRVAFFGRQEEDPDLTVAKLQVWDMRRCYCQINNSVQMLGVYSLSTCTPSWFSVLSGLCVLCSRSGMFSMQGYTCSQTPSCLSAVQASAATGPKSQQAVL